LSVRTKEAGYQYLARLTINVNERNWKMRKYGLQIGSTGVEFSDQQTREKALLMFTKGSCISVSMSSGRRYRPSEGAFSTYERDTEEQTMNCSKCEGSFSSEVCTQREVPAMDWYGKFKDEGTDTKYLCDACHAKILKDYEVHKAKQVVANAKSDI
jgi:hypothetical protein